MTGRDFEEQVATLLKEAGLTFQRDPLVGGLQPDFIITGPRNRRVVIEAKAWDPRGGHTARALEQAAHYQALAGVDKAFVVLPTLSKNFEARGVISADELIAAVTSFFREPSHRYKRDNEGRSRARRTIFAAMPFSRDYDDTYFVAMSHAAAQVNAACTRVDKEEFAGDIVEEIKRLITASAGVIVDLSEGQPNVLYEAGFAHALGKPTVHICSTPLTALPFDVRNWNTVPYRRGQTTKLRHALARRLRAALD
jgi:hypothetical protein